MRVMPQSPDPLARMHTMTKRQGKSETIDVKVVLADDEEFLRALVRMALQEVLEAEMTEALSAEKGERVTGRQGYRSGYYGRTLNTRVGKLESRSTWGAFLLGLMARGLHGVGFVVADDHAGIRAALREGLAEAAYQRCWECPDLCVRRAVSPRFEPSAR